MVYRYLTVVWDESWEESAKKITPSPHDMDDHMRAAEIMAQRGLALEIEIPNVPGTNVFVFRMEAGRSNFPPTRWYFRADGEHARFVWVEAVDDSDDDGASQG